MKSAVLVYPYGHLDQTPCVQVLSKYIGKIGSSKLLCLKNTNVKSVSGDSINSEIISYKSHVSGVRENFFSVMLGFYLWSIWNILRSDSKTVVLVGERALPLSYISKIIRKKVLFLSLELYFPEDFGGAGLKYCLYNAFQRAMLVPVQRVLIQDMRRAKLLCALTGYKLSKCAVYPNIPYLMESENLSGIVSNKAAFNKKDKMIVIYSGSIFAKWSGIDEIRNINLENPSNFVLLLHSRVNANCDDLPKNTNIPIEYSKPGLSSKGYDDLIKSCDIGMAFYDAQHSRNIKYVGLSSGKILHYLARGKPVIVNRIPFWAQFVKENRIGCVVDSFDGLGDAVQRIHENYQEYSRNVLHVFGSISKSTEADIHRIIKELA